MCFTIAKITNAARTPLMVSGPIFPDSTGRKKVGGIYCQALLARIFWALSSVFFALGASTLAHAAPIVYSEAIGGELPDGATLQAVGAPVFNLEAGLNTVSGQLSETSGFNGAFDAFGFVVPQGFQLSSVQFSYSNPINFSSVGLGFAPGVGLPFRPTITDSIGVIDASPRIIFTSTTPLGAGTYSMGNFVINGTTSGGPISVDYTFTLNVQKIAAHTQVQSRPQLDALKSVLGAFFPKTPIVRKSAVVLVHGWSSDPDKWAVEMATKIRGMTLPLDSVSHNRDHELACLASHSLSNCIGLT